MTTIKVSGRLISIPGFILDKKGKPTRKPPGNVSARIRQKKSRKQKPVRRTV